MLFTLGEWIQELVERSGIQMEENETHISAAYSYGVIEESVQVNESDPLTKEWMAYTLVNLTGLDSTDDCYIEDLDESRFPDHIRRCTPLMDLDHNRFHPSDQVEKQEALSILDQAVSICNKRVIKETTTDVQWKQDAEIKQLDTPPVVDSKGRIEMQEGLEAGDIICWHGMDDSLQFAEIMADPDDFGLYLSDVDPLSISDSIHLSGSTNVDFSKAQIIDGNGDVIIDNRQSGIEPTAIRNYTTSFDLSEWKVTLSAASTGLKAEVSKEMQNGSKAYANIRVSGLRFDYEWLSQQQTIQDVYFKVAFNSEENFGVRHTSYRKLYGDFSKVDPSDFVSTVKNFFQDADHCVQKTLTLATINVQVPSAPGVSVQMKVDLNIYVSGKIEITMSQGHVLGCEIRNGKTRLIQKMTPEHTEDIRATAKVTTGLRFGLKMAGFELCNAALLAGVESSMTTSLHLYDNNGDHTVITTDLPADVADELSQGNGNVVVCADLDAHIIGEVDLNSKASVLGKLGLGKTITIFTSKNASLLPQGMKHLENFHFMAECTRKGSSEIIFNDAVKVTGKITLERYAYALNINGYRTIVVTGLPEGYTKEDLVYETNQSDVAIVSENGRVTGRKAGSAEITISTQDGRHTAYVSILVKTS